MNLNSKDDRILRNLRRIKGDNRMNNKELAKAMGISEATLYKLYAGDEISEKYIDNLSKNLGIAKEWIIEGDSYPIALRESPGVYTSPRKELIPYYDVDATLALDEVINDQTTKPTYYLDVPAFADCHFAINVYGHSMHPTIENGSIVFCRKLEDKRLIMPGEIYLIITDEWRSVKRLKLAKRNGYVIASSDNKEANLYADHEISLDKIKKIYLVKGSIKRHLI